MREIRLMWPEVGAIGVTRAVLGFGLGLLLAGRISRRRRVTVGATLAALSALSTIPIGMRVLRRQRKSVSNGHAGVERAPAMG